jgi:rhodanese-related sulfurtransferase
MNRRGASVIVNMVREWPDKEFIAETLSIFPDEGVANAEQARCLFSNGGYTYLDVRSALEVDEVGKVKDSVNIPWMICTRVWDAQEQKKVVKKENNVDFMAQIQRRFPNKDAKLLVACSNGTQYSIDALEALDEAGYTNIVGLRGGYTSWFRTWDNKLQRRRYGEYEENYIHDGDSGGIHASGAGFDRVDKIESWRPPVY